MAPFIGILLASAFATTREHQHQTTTTTTRQRQQSVLLSPLLSPSTLPSASSSSCTRSCGCGGCCALSYRKKRGDSRRYGSVAGVGLVNDNDNDNDNDNNDDDSLQQQQYYSLSRLCELFGAEPKDAVSLRTNPKTGIRGVYLNNNNNNNNNDDESVVLEQNEIILSMPLEACLRDDMPPDWLGDDDDDDCGNTNNNSDTNNRTSNDAAVSVEGWVARLAASLFDVQQQQQQRDDQSEAVREWLRLLPTNLREILPIHWNENENEDSIDSIDDNNTSNLLLAKARSPSLQLAVDSARCARSGPIGGIVSSWTNHHCHGSHEHDETNGGGGVETREQQLRRSIEDAWDLVQTRSCRAESRFCADDDGTTTPATTTTMRVLVPIFDMINHHRDPNAAFFLEGDNMVVRATRPIEPNTEVFIDYGPSATRPAWRCLFSYGFVPLSEDVYEDDASELVLEDTAKHGGAVVVEVGPTEIPFELVRYEAEQSGKNKQHGNNNDDGGGEVEFDFEIGERILDRITAEAKQLEGWSAIDSSSSSSSSLAARSIMDLRESNRRTLLTCAGGFREFLEGNN